MVLAVGCGRASEPVAPGAAGQEAPPVLPPDTVQLEGGGSAYPGSGLRAHEWGTNTIVVGSDGSMQRGLHHEEEDLPGFVYDRRAVEVVDGSVDVKMETPVLYLYSEKPLSGVKAKVRFPSGILTQWYPAVTAYAPFAWRGMGDPMLDPDFPFSTPECRARHAQPSGGELDWQLDILGRGEPITEPEAPLDRFTWSHARAVAANPLHVGGSRGGALPSHAPQEERFLFYRGLGNFPIGARVTAESGRGWPLRIENLDARERLGAVFVLRVGADTGSFAIEPEGVEPGGSLALLAPGPLPMEEYVQKLAEAMAAALERSGLYRDEATSMVRTWARQWFRTPGVRVLYLAPRAWTDAQIPLEISPAPVETVRVMVMRVEAISPADENLDRIALGDLANADAARRAAGEKHFRALGRFAEPRLRRALQLVAASPDPAGATAPEVLALLGAIASVDTRIRAGE